MQPIENFSLDLLNTGRETGFEKRRACAAYGAAPGKLINDSRKLIKGMASSEIS